MRNKLPAVNEFKNKSILTKLKQQGLEPEGISSNFCTLTSCVEYILKINFNDTYLYVRVPGNQEGVLDIDEFNKAVDATKESFFKCSTNRSIYSGFVSWQIINKSFYNSQIWHLLCHSNLVETTDSLLYKHPNAIDFLIELDSMELDWLVDESMERY